MTLTHHLLTLWNPSYAADAMDEHLRVLLDWAGRWRRGETDADDVYVWWGRIRSANRKGPLPHADAIGAIDGQIRAGVETHLYLTDYRSLYVGHLGEITSDHLPESAPGELDHMPDYYRKMFSDFWFRLWDIRRLVADDTPAVIEELKSLTNTRYHDRPVSLYGGMVDLPLVVARADEVSWFGDRDFLTDGHLWAERESEMRGQTERTGREIRENLLGPDVWAALEPASRTFLSSAEAVFRARREDPGFDFSGPAVEYAKAVETELNALLFPRLRKVYAGWQVPDRSVLLEGRSVDLGLSIPPQPLGALKVLLEKKPVIQQGVRAGFPHDHAWILGALPHALKRIVEIRNPAAHARKTSRDTLLLRRAEIMGIGCEGLIVRLARAKLRGRS